MSSIFISGSSTGLGMMAAELLVSRGHEVVLHARDVNRADDARRRLPRAKAIVVGDLGTIAETKEVAKQVNGIGHFDAVIHNAAVGYREERRTTADGLPHVFAINTLSAFLLTALIKRPKRLVYLSSGMHHHAKANLNDILWRKRSWDGSTAYAESKLHDAMLAFAVAAGGLTSSRTHLSQAGSKRKWAGLERRTTCFRLTSRRCGSSGDDPKANVTGEYFYHLKQMAPNPRAKDVRLQDHLIALCSEISGVSFPA